MSDLERETEYESLGSSKMNRARFLKMGLAAAPALASLSAFEGVARAKYPNGPSMAPSNLQAGHGKPIIHIPTKRWHPSKVAGPKPVLPRTAAYAETVSNQVLAELGTWFSDACKAHDVKYLEATPNGNDALYNTEMRTYISSGKVGALFMLDNIWAEDIFSAEASIKAGLCQVSLHDAPGTMLVSEAIYDQGYLSAEGAVKYLKANPSIKPQIIYEYTKSDLSLYERYRGALDCLKHYGYTKDLLEVLDCKEPTATDAQQALTGALQAHPSTNIVICQNDDVGAGAYAAMLAAGKSDPSQYGVFSADGSGQALAIIGSGKPSIWKATAATYVPIIGYGVARWIVDWFNGYTMPQVVLLTPFLLDSKPVIDKWNKGLADYVSITNKCRAGDNTYATPLGEISYATRGRYFNGVNTGVIPQHLT